MSDIAPNPRASSPRYLRVILFVLLVTEINSAFEVGAISICAALSVLVVLALPRRQDLAVAAVSNAGAASALRP